MPKETENYSLKKPLYSENADIAVLNENFDEIDKTLTPTLNSTNEPGTQSKGKLEIVLGWITNRIKAITGKSMWQESPSVTLEDCAKHIDNDTHQNATTTSNGFMSFTDKAKLNNATSDNIASRLMMRDSAGRAKVQNPSDASDIVNKDYVDTNFVKRNAATTMSAKLTAQSNTEYSTKQVRNIVFWTSGTTPPATNNGDVIIKTF